MAWLPRILSGWEQCCVVAQIGTMSKCLYSPFQQDVKTVKHWYQTDGHIISEREHSNAGVADAEKTDRERNNSVLDNSQMSLLRKNRRIQSC